MLTPAPGPRLGNFLYFWLHAHVMRRTGHPFVVRTPDYMDEWLDLLPGIRDDLSVPADGVRVRDKRVWPEKLLHQRYGVDFEDEDLAAFIDEYLLGTPLLPRVPPPTNDVVVNVRRGDYYSKASNRAEYGFDVVSYVTRAVSELAEQRPLTDLLVVSDDPRWCRDHLDAPLSRFVDARSFSAEHDSAEDNFRSLVETRRFVGSNSTFSYWAAYVIGHLHADASVVMPAFHARSVDNGNAFQLAPSWTALVTQPDAATMLHPPASQGDIT
jgi:hypothetical protein